MDTNAQLFGDETNKEPFIPLVHILTEKHENEQTWSDKWSHHPEFGKLVIARSLGVKRREVRAEKAVGSVRFFRGIFEPNQAHLTSLPTA
jgi:hypothetical protein